MMSKITVSDAGRLGGQSRSPQKILAARKNVALARAAAEKSLKKIIAARNNIAIARQRLAELKAQKNIKNNT